MTTKTRQEQAGEQPPIYDDDLTAERWYNMQEVENPDSIKVGDRIGYLVYRDGEKNIARCGVVKNTEGRNSFNQELSDDEIQLKLGEGNGFIGPIMSTVNYRQVKRVERGGS